MLRLVSLSLALLLPVTAYAEAVSHKSALRTVTPPAGKLQHGVYPGGTTGAEDDITPAQVASYERAARHKVAWVYFSHNWYQSRVFPTKTARWIRKRGAIPYVRLMIRTDTELYQREPRFTLRAIAGGDFDADLTAWGAAAARFKTPIIAEFGTEMNGEWFSWNGRWNGRKLGAPRFIAAYRHIIDLTRAAGANNIIWVFHPNYADWPRKNWNRMENYYPGDSYIDWLAVSIYSMQSPIETEATPFKAIHPTMQRLTRLAPSKPVVIAEFGTDVRNPHEPAAQWADAAFKEILSGRWPNLIGFSWWNETWENDGTPANDTDMRVQSSPALAAVFRRALKSRRIAR